MIAAAAAAAGVVVARQDDDDDCHEYRVHVGLACGVGGVDDEIVPDEREAAKILASDQGHYYYGHLSKPSKFLGNRIVMALLLPLLSDSVEGLYLSLARLQHR